MTPVPAVGTQEPINHSDQSVDASGAEAQEACLPQPTENSSKLAEFPPKEPPTLGQ